jgi:SH3 domain protein
MMIRWVGKAVLMLFAGLVLFAGPVRAETMYVTDTFEITMRATPGVGKKIVAMLPSNTKVQTGERRGGWVLVRTAQGKKGWVLERYLTAETPGVFLVQKLTSGNEALQSSLHNATVELDLVKEENARLHGALNSTEAQLADLQGVYEGLLDEAEGFLDLKSRHAAMSVELEEASSTIDRLRKENEALHSEQRYKWFFSGGGMVLFTLILGFWFGRIKRRQSSRISL